MGDVGARLLAKALQINTRLKTIYLDRNNITLQGYQVSFYLLLFQNDKITYSVEVFKHVFLFFFS